MGVQITRDYYRKTTQRIACALREMLNKGECKHLIQAVDKESYLSRSWLLVEGKKSPLNQVVRFRNRELGFLGRRNYYTCYYNGGYMSSYIFQDPQNEHQEWALCRLWSLGDDNVPVLAHWLSQRYPSGGDGCVATERRGSVRNLFLPWIYSCSKK